MNRDESAEGGSRGKMQKEPLLEDSMQANLCFYIGKAEIIGQESIDSGPVRAHRRGQRQA